MLPTLRQLQYLVLLAEHGSFQRAAEAAGIGQPALSAAIQELERLLGGPVVERIRNDIQLTPIGLAARRGADEILARTRDLVEAARTPERPFGRPLRLGVIPTVGPFMLPPALAQLRQEHPSVQLFLREAVTGRLLEDLRAGKLDCAIIALPHDSEGLDQARIGFDEFLAAAPLGHALGEWRAVSPGALPAEELILLERGHCLRDHVLAAVGPGRADVGFAASSLHTLGYMIAAGSGVSAIPALALGAGIAAAGQLVVRNFETPPPGRELVLVWRAAWSRAPEARLMADVFRRVTKPLLIRGARSSRQPR